MEDKVHIKCVNHEFKPDRDRNEEGWGKCSECIPHEDNVRCKGYIRITIREFYVRSREERE